MLVYLRDGSAQTILHAATLILKLQIKFSISPSHSILTPGRPVPTLTLSPQAPGRVATGVPILSHWYDSTLKKSWHKQDSNPGSSAVEADALTTRPTRRFTTRKVLPFSYIHFRSTRFPHWNLHNRFTPLWGVQHLCCWRFANFEKRRSS